MPLGLIGGGIALAAGASLGTAAAVGLAGAAIGSTVAGVYGASQQAGIAHQQMGMAQTVFGEQQSFEQQLAKLVQDPSSITSTPGYQFNLDQGAGAVARQMGAGGYLGSGNEGAALAQYGQGYAMSTYNQQVQMLAQLAGITQPTSTTQAGANAIGAQGASTGNINNMMYQLGMLGGRFNLGGAGTPSANAADIASQQYGTQAINEWNIQTGGGSVAPLFGGV